MINKNMTIEEAVKDNPNIIEKLEQVGIDYCCGGSAPLEDAISEIGFDPDAFINILNNIEKPVELDSKLEEAINLDTDKLIDYIITVHHKIDLELIEEIDKSLRKGIKAHYINHGDNLKDIYQVFLLIKADLIPHFAAEEEIDFPKLKRGEKLDFSTLIAEHEKVGSLLERIKNLTNDFKLPEDACATYSRSYELLKELSDDLKTHIFLENNELFTR